MSVSHDSVASFLIDDNLSPLCKTIFSYLHRSLSSKCKYSCRSRSIDFVCRSMRHLGPDLALDSSPSDDHVLLRITFAPKVLNYLSPSQVYNIAKNIDFIYN